MDNAGAADKTSVAGNMDAESNSTFYDLNISKVLFKGPIPIPSDEDEVPSMDTVMSLEERHALSHIPEFDAFKVISVALSDEDVHSWMMRRDPVPHVTKTQMDASVSFTFAQDEYDGKEAKIGIIVPHMRAKDYYLVSNYCSGWPGGVFWPALTKLTSISGGKPTTVRGVVSVNKYPVEFLEFAWFPNGELCASIGMVFSGARFEMKSFVFCSSEDDGTMPSVIKECQHGVQFVRCPNCIRDGRKVCVCFNEREKEMGEQMNLLESWSDWVNFFKFSQNGITLYKCEAFDLNKMSRGQFNVRWKHSCNSIPVPSREKYEYLHSLGLVEKILRGIQMQQHDAYFGRTHAREKQKLLLESGEEYGGLPHFGGDNENDVMQVITVEGELQTATTEEVGEQGEHEGRSKRRLNAEYSEDLFIPKRQRLIPMGITDQLEARLPKVWPQGERLQSFDELCESLVHDPGARAVSTVSTQLILQQSLTKAQNQMDSLKYPEHFARNLELQSFHTGKPPDAYSSTGSASVLNPLLSSNTHPANPNEQHLQRQYRQHRVYRQQLTHSGSSGCAIASKPNVSPLIPEASCPTSAFRLPSPYIGKPLNQLAEVNHPSDATHHGSMHPTTRAESSSKSDQTMIQSPSNSADEKQKSKTGDEKLVCLDCGKEFATSSNYSRHRRSVHEKATMFSCDQCPRTFTSKSNLVRHVSDVHLGLREFSCRFCTSTFPRKFDLRRHESNVHALETLARDDKPQSK